MKGGQAPGPGRGWDGASRAPERHAVWEQQNRGGAGRRQLRREAVGALNGGRARGGWACGRALGPQVGAGTRSWLALQVRADVASPDGLQADPADPPAAAAAGWGE